MADTCSIPGCDKPRLARGVCLAHYNRLRRHGDPMGGGTSPGEPMRFFNEVILAYDGDECFIWPYGKTGEGYGQLWRDDSHKHVHRLVCEAVNGPPPSTRHDAAHTCGKGHEGCVTKRHLVWKTRAGNMADKLIHGTHNRGERSRDAKLNSDQVLEIRALRGIEAGRSIAGRFGVSPQTVCDIQAGRKWAWL